ncbi:MAG: AraC family transcriptional regulator [Verrucomicrobiota bacterium]
MRSANWNEAFFADLLNPAQFSLLIDALPDAYFFAKDCEGRFVAMNRALLSALGGQEADEVLGRCDYDFFPHDLADAYRAEDELVIESRQPVVNQVWYVPNVSTGDLNWYVSNKIPLLDRNEKVFGVAGMMRGWEPSAEDAAEHRKMTEVARFMELHFAEKLSVEQLAKRSALSVRQFQRVFRRVFRLGPIEHLARIRIRSACSQLAETDRSLSEIAIECGFYDQSHFSNQFRRVKGVSPSRYRKRFRPE